MTITAAAETVRMDKAEPDEFGHRWVGAATVSLTPKDARRADLRGSIRVPGDTRIDVLETYCAGCRRPYEDVAGRKCAHIDDPELFHGGPLGQRAKRTGHTIPGHDCVALGCNTGIALDAARQAAAKRNGLAPDTRRQRAVLASAPAAVSPAVRKPVTQAPPGGRVKLASVSPLSPDAEASQAARLLAARRGRRRQVNPWALMLW